MRKALVVLTVLAALALYAVPASAVVSNPNNLPAAEYQAKYSDYSDLYIPPAAGSTNWTPLGFGVTPTAGEEDRAIFQTTSILNDLTQTTEWTNTTGYQLTGLFYNLNLALVVPTTTAGNLSAVSLYFTQSTRNPLPGTPAGYGGVIEVYNSSTLNFNPNPGAISPLAGSALPATGTSQSTVNTYFGSHNVGPNYWVQGTGGSSRDSYVGANSGTLWLSGTFVDWATVAPYNPVLAAQLAAVDLLDPGLDPVFSETIDLATGTGSGEGDIHLLGGSFFSQVGKGDLGLGPAVDLTLISDLSTPTDLITAKTNTLYPSSGSYSGVGYWPVDSQDPVTFNIIPEPATMTLLGLGLLGIGAIRRRVRKV